MAVWHTSTVLFLRIWCMLVWFEAQPCISWGVGHFLDVQERVESGVRQVAICRVAITRQGTKRIRHGSTGCREAPGRFHVGRNWCPV